MGTKRKKHSIWYIAHNTKILANCLVICNYIQGKKEVKKEQHTTQNEEYLKIHFTTINQKQNTKIRTKKKKKKKSSKLKFNQRWISPKRIKIETSKSSALPKTLNELTPPP